MPAPNQDPKQEPAFRVTKSTADLVPLDFELYKPSLQRMAEDWRAEKEHVMRQKKARADTPISENR
jgi:hypothetical protein